MSQDLTVEQKNALAALTADEQRRGLTVKSIVGDMKASSFFKQSWDELLIAAPNCLEILGRINSLASTDSASTTPLSPPKEGFKYLQDYGFLKGALSQVTNAGSLAFSEARTQMLAIRKRSESIPEKLKDIMKALADPTIEMDVVVELMEDMKRTAEGCQEAAQEIENAMGTWSKTCMELDAACSSESASTETKKKRAALNLQLAEDDKKLREEQEKSAKAELLKLNTQMDDAKKTYEKTLEKMPTGMDLVGQSVLHSLGEGLSNILSVGANAMANKYSQTNASTSGGQDLKDEANKFNGNGSGPKTTSKPGTDGNVASKPTQDDKLPDPDKASAKRSIILGKMAATFVRRAKPRDNENVPSEKVAPGNDGSTRPGPDHTTKTSANGEAKPTVSEKGATAPKTSNTSALSKDYGTYDLSGKFYKDDPALVIAPTVKTAIEQLKNIVVGLPDGIKWSSVLVPTDPTKGDIPEVKRLTHSLDRSWKDLKPKKDGLASQLMNAIILESIAVGDDLLQEAENNNNLKGWVKPDKKSDFYKDLDARITRCASTAIALDTAAKSTPGGVGFNNGTLFRPQQTTEERIAKSKERASLIEQSVKLATTKLISTQEVYTATLETYQKQTEQVLLVQDNLLKARQSVTSLIAEGATLKTVQDTLVNCMSYLNDLKDRISKLVFFFGTLTIIIKSCVSDQVIPFEAKMVSFQKKAKDKAVLYGNFYRDLIYKYVLKISADFSLYQDVAGMYLDVDKKCIEPGMKLVGKLLLSNIDPKMSDKDFLINNEAELKKFCDGAAQDVRTIVKAKQTEIITGLQKRIEEISSRIEKFPVPMRPTPQIEAAAKDGANLIQTMTETEAAAPSTIATNLANMPRLMPFDDDDE